MITDQRVTAYINSLDRGNHGWLNRLEREAVQNHVPVIRKETQNLLKFLLQLARPGGILEIGTAVGFSALLMNEYGGCPVTTVELNKRRILTAAKNIARAGKSKEIRLVHGDAEEILPTLQEEYGFIFLDAAKGQYLNFLPEILRLLEPGGVLVSDNVLQGGDIVESRFAVTRRNRTIHKRMRRYLYEIKNHPCLSTTVLPVGDGVTVSVKIQ